MVADFTCKKTKTNDKKLKQLYACNDAVNCFIDTVNENTKRTKFNDSQKELFKASLSIWNDKKAKYNRDLNDWANRINAYSVWEVKKKELESYSRIWVNCAFPANTTAGTNNEWCINDFGQGYYHSGQASGQGCPAFQGKGICSYTQERVLKELDNLGYQNAKPVLYDIEPKDSDFPLKQELALNDLSIQCCSNYVSGSNIKDNILSCQQTISKSLPSANGVKPVGVDVPVSPLKDDKPEPIPVSSDWFTNLQNALNLSFELTITLIVLSILLILSSISSLFVM